MFDWQVISHITTFIEQCKDFNRNSLQASDFLHNKMSKTSIFKLIGGEGVIFLAYPRSFN